MIIDTALRTIGILLGLATVAGLIALALVAFGALALAYDHLANTRPAWWLRARRARRRLRRGT